MATTRAAAAAAGSMPAAAAAAPAPTAASRRSTSRRGTPATTPGPLPPAAAAPAAAAGPGPSSAPASPPNEATAVLVPVDEEVESMSIWRKLGRLATSEPGIDASLVVVEGKPLGGMSFDAINMACGPLVSSYAPIPGQPHYADALTAGREIEAGAHTVDSTGAFRKALAREGVAKCLVYLALAAGLLKRGGGYVFLPSMFDVAEAKGRPVPKPAARAAPLDPVLQEEVSKAVAIQLAAMEKGKKGGGGAAGAAAGGKGDTEVDPDQAGLRELTKKHANTEVWDDVTRVVKILRNEKREYNYSHLRAAMEELVQLINTIGSDDLVGLRETLESVLRRGNDLILDGADPVYTLRLFSELMPSRRAGKNSMRLSDRSRLVQMWKAQGGGRAVAGGPFAGGAAGASVAAAAAGATAQPFYSSAPLPVQAPLAVTLPLSGTAAAPPAATKPRGGGTRAAPAGAGGGRTPSGPPRVPSARATQERNTFNAAIRARQEAFLPSPMNTVCADCQTAGRNPNHQPHECAYSECPKCKRGGHRARRCRFPAYP